MILFRNTVNRKKLKAWKFQSHRLISFSAIKGTVNGVEAVIKFVLFLSLFLYVNVNFKYILSSHKIIFMKIVNLFSSIFQLVFLICKFIVSFLISSFLKGQVLALPEMCHTYPAMKNLGTVVPYLKKIQKIIHLTHPMSFSGISTFSMEIWNFLI